MAVTLSGITWNHTRGYVPLVATAQRFEERHPDVSISWKRRSLQAFADQSIAHLTDRYDLIILDHPWTGALAKHDLVVPLDQHLDLADSAAHSVGLSHASYVADGRSWALAVDAATPVASWRPDILARHDLAPPETWDDLLALASRGLVALPAIPLDALMHLYMLCIALGEPPFAGHEEMVPREIGVQALEMLRDLVTRCDPACLQRNPIRTYEAMTTGDDIAYCPFAYGYVTYATPVYTDKPLRFGPLVSHEGQALRSTLGGTGLAISSGCRDLETAIDYAAYVASPTCQAGIYAATGGQPGHRAAWLDPEVNARSADFYADTLPTLDNSWLRPTYDGYVPFQDAAGPMIHPFLVAGGDPGATIDAVNARYRESRVTHVR